MLSHRMIAIITLIFYEGLYDATTSIGGRFALPKATERVELATARSPCEQEVEIYMLFKGENSNTTKSG